MSCQGPGAEAGRAGCRGITPRSARQASLSRSRGNETLFIEKAKEPRVTSQNRSEGREQATGQSPASGA